MPILTQAVINEDSESGGHQQRVRELSRRLTPMVASPAECIFELCNDFDEAVEFAALEGRSSAEAVALFLREAEGPATPEFIRLAGRATECFEIPTGSLPVMPRQVSRILRTSNASTSIGELENIAASDPVLTGRLLGAANSALFGSEFEIVSVRHAVMRLGVPEARKILLNSCLGGIFGSKELRDLWEHSQAVAEATCYLADLAGVDREMAYVTGLLHDIGRLALTKMAAKARIAEREWCSAGFPLAYAEILAHGVDHAALGARILGDWDVPEEVRTAVGIHHRPGRSGLPLAAVVTLAEDLTARHGGQPSEDLWPDMRRTAACATLGIEREQLEAFRTEIPSFGSMCG
jgi:putative nucleotidyltransferase with HDIG domain